MGWKEDKFQIHILKLQFQFIHVNISTIDGQVWALTSVYVIPREEKKKALWKELEGIVHNMNIGWMVGETTTILKKWR